MTQTGSLSKRSITNGRLDIGRLKRQRYAEKQGSSPCPVCHAYNQLKVKENSMNAKIEFLNEIEYKPKLKCANIELQLGYKEYEIFNLPMSRRPLAIDRFDKLPHCVTYNRS